MLSCNSVHPHGRGDNIRCLRMASRSRGSPPRAWGQSSRSSLCQKLRRFTPTGVGTIVYYPRQQDFDAVHPHGRGDNSLWRGGQWLDGSPPRAWGQLCAFFGVASPVRFTPTGVGTIGARACTGICGAVHPHGRGDNDAGEDRNLLDDGSPPRAWGQFPVAGARRIATRFTPTGVGTILIFLFVLSAPSVHPHGRGDNR